MYVQNDRGQAIKRSCLALLKRNNSLSALQFILVFRQKTKGGSSGNFAEQENNKETRYFEGPKPIKVQRKVGERGREAGSG